MNSTPYRIIRSSLAAVACVAVYCVVAPVAPAEQAEPPAPTAPTTPPAPAEPAAPAQPAAPIAPVEPAANSSIGLPQGSVLVPDGHSMTEVGAVTVNTLLQRKWEVTSRTDGRIVARIDHRDEQATLTVDYSTSEISFYTISASGKPKGATHVSGWVSNLRKDLNKYFYPKAKK